jgi:hypothetical protein
VGGARRSSVRGNCLRCGLRGAEEGGRKGLERRVQRKKLPLLLLTRIVQRKGGRRTGGV